MGSYSKSVQKTITKDDSAVLQDQAVNAVDGGTVVSGDGQSVRVGNRSRLAQNGNDSLSGNTIGAGGDLKFTGSTVNIESVDDDTIAAASEIVGNSNENLHETLRDVIGFAQVSQDAANDQVERTTSQYGSFIDAKTEDATSENAKALQGTILKGAGLLSLVVIIVTLATRTKSNG